MLVARVFARCPGVTASGLLSLPMKKNITIKTRSYSSLKKAVKFIESRCATPTNEEFVNFASAKSMKIGQAAVIGASAFALGSLCYYGAGMSKKAGAIDTHKLWPQYVKDRIKTTYSYVGGGLAFAAATVALITRSPALMRIFSNNPIKFTIVGYLATTGSLTVCMKMPYKEEFGIKHLAFMVFYGIFGAAISPVAMLGGPILVRAAVYTAGIIGGLSSLAICAPSDKFLYMGGPLFMGLGVLIAAGIVSFFVSPLTTLGTGLYSFHLYGGLIVVGGLVLYDTQKVIEKAKNHPLNDGKAFDPINASLGIYLDIVTIFLNIADILCMNQKLDKLKKAVNK